MALQTWLSPGRNVGCITEKQKQSHRGHLFCSARAPGLLGAAAAAATAMNGVLVCRRSARRSARLSRRRRHTSRRRSDRRAIASIQAIQACHAIEAREPVPTCSDIRWQVIQGDEKEIKTENHIVKECCSASLFLCNIVLHADLSLSIARLCSPCSCEGEENG